MFKDIYRNLDYRSKEKDRYFKILSQSELVIGVENLNTIFNYEHGVEVIFKDLARFLEASIDDDDLKESTSSLIFSYGHLVISFLKLVKAIDENKMNDLKPSSVKYQSSKRISGKKVEDMQKIISFEEYRLDLKNCKNIKKEIINLSQAIDVLESSKTPLRFRWKYHFSGGEQQKLAYVVLFSSLKDIKAERMLICLDEPDTYLHPEWERYIVKDLVELVRVFLSKKTDVNIVLTTNKPIILTDLPKYSVKYIGDDMKIMQSSFYLDIHDLYRDNFFVEASVGQYALDKMNKLQDSLKRGVVTDDILDLINQIGDEYIRKRLLSQYNGILEQRELNEYSTLSQHAAYINNKYTKGEIETLLSKLEEKQ